MKPKLSQNGNYSEINCIRARTTDFYTLNLDNIQKESENLSKLIAIALTLPMSTASAERGFSNINEIKTKKRNRMKSDLLDLLMIVANMAPNVSDKEAYEQFLFNSYVQWHCDKNRYDK